MSRYSEDSATRLESDLTAAHGEIERLKAELAVAKSAPSDPSHLVHATGGHWHAFRSGVDAYNWMQGNKDASPAPYLVYSWTWHPAKPAKEATDG